MEANWKKKGFIISKLFSCLLEWLMVIDPMILSETELCQLVFDVIEYALHITSVCINSVMDIKYTSKIKTHRLLYIGRRIRKIAPSSSRSAIREPEEERSAVQIQVAHRKEAANPSRVCERCCSRSL